MKKSFLLFLLTVLLFSCSKDEVEPIISSISEILPSNKKVRIADTIVFKGSNLSEINKIVFISPETSVIAQPIYINNDEIRVVVPILHNENIKLKFLPDKISTPQIEFNLIGTFELRPNGFGGETISNVEMIDENIIYAGGETKLFKSSDGGYEWIYKHNFYEGIRDVCFVDENRGWVSTAKKIYFTNDGGTTFNIVFSFPEYGNNNYIAKIHFNSVNNGYFLTIKGDIYETLDNLNFNLAYDCPNNNDTGNSVDFDSLDVYNNSLLAYGYVGSNYDPTLIKKHNNAYNFSVFNDPVIYDCQLVSENRGYLIGLNVIGEYNFIKKVYYSDDLENWIDTGATTQMEKLYFINNDVGIGISSDENAPGPHLKFYRVYETFDGGQNWKLRYTSKGYFEICRDIDFFNKSGISCGTNRIVRKHIFE
ncbi:hypothetical protein M0M57_12845 [Flavobacterium azooxidireducens]|uniref:IPT/TIG domain-containing protein n=1 Tax=Flavobacterium azooxidireducens TaxID=1871076 RepID=A0ABY4KGC0_9FLAO|nr:IPT/TIG domain-containing protein [Flavobacterium azooxidireducens]UPQ78502.1 hypothetical protein M0M57_12845 [Flavobacterium azooxidireducens]